MVNIPRPEKITNITSAWDYASKVCLKNRELAILFCPPPPLDKELAQDIYDMFDFVGFDKNQGIIRRFELRHSFTPAKNIQEIKKRLTSDVKRTTESDKNDIAGSFQSNKYQPRDTRHISLPSNSGCMARTSIAFLYGAIICCVLRDMSRNIMVPPSVSSRYAKAIYYLFSSLIIIDLRHSHAFIDLLKISSDIENYGYHAAAVRNSISTNICKNCSNPGKKQFVEMCASNTIPPKWNCPQCHGTEQLRRGLTTKHLKNSRDQILRKAKGVVTYVPLFEEIKTWYGYTIAKNREYVMKLFQEYEDLARKDLLSKRECYCIMHYDSSKKWKKKSCYISEDELASVVIKDNRYDREYKPLIIKFLNQLVTHSIDSRRTLSLLKLVLRDFGWNEKYIMNKICADLTSLSPPISNSS